MDEKQRSESLPGTSEQVHIQRPYTGAISKLKTTEPRDVLSSQDSGINMSFQDDDRMKKFSRNSVEMWEGLKTRIIAKINLSILF